MSSDCSYCLPKVRILRGRKNFQRLFGPAANTLYSSHVQLRFCVFSKEEHHACQMGFIVSKKLGKAVRRNRVRRLLKETYRLHQSILLDALKPEPIGFHGALMARTTDLDFSTARQNMVELLEKARLHIRSKSDL